MGAGFRAAVAAMQVAHDKARNLERYRQMIHEAHTEGVRLLVFPEASLQGFLFHLDHRFDSEESEYHWEHAETVPGPSTEVMVELAGEHDMYVIFGLMERVDHPAAPVLQNSAVLVGPEGHLGTYRKVHQPSEERIYYRAGRDWPVFETPLGAVGMMICYDQSFPEAARELTLRGAEVLAVPNAWPASDRASNDRYDFYGRARAAENARWVMQSNQVGSSDRGNFEYMGCSRIIDPTGVVVAQTAEGDAGLAIAEIAPTKFDPTRARSGWYLQQRVPSTYTSLCDVSQYE